MSLPFLLTRPWVVLDVETTSADPATARIVEISLERYEVDGRLTAYSTLINPGVPIPAEATAIHGITDAMVADAPSWAVRGPQILRAFRTDTDVADLGGYNVRFDCKVIAAENERHHIPDETPAGATPPRVVDGFRLWQFLEPRSLSDAARRWLGSEHTGAHRGAADVAVTREVIAAQIACDSSLAGKTLAEIDALVNPRDEAVATADGKMRFVPGGVAFNQGKHKGVPLQEVPVGYLQWAKKEDFSRDSKALIEQELTRRSRPCQPPAA